jgi:hypothetical protein
MRSMASRLRSTSASVVAQEETLMRMAVRCCHSVGPHQDVPVLLNACDHAGGVFGSAEGHQHLVQYDVIQDLEAGAREAVRETLGAAAIAVDQLGQSTAA